MLTYLGIAVGSALGGAGRYWCSGLIARYVGETFPWGILFVNVLGSMLIGLFATLTGPDGRWLLGSTARQFFMVGVLGGFTTFSSFSLQTLGLIQTGEWLRAAANVLGSVLLCLVGVWLGHAAGLAVNRIGGGCAQAAVSSASSGQVADKSWPNRDPPIWYGLGDRPARGSARSATITNR